MGQEYVLLVRFRYLRALGSFHGERRPVPDHRHRTTYLVVLIGEGAQSRNRLGKDVKRYNKFGFIFLVISRFRGYMQVCQEEKPNRCILPELS